MWREGFDLMKLRMFMPAGKHKTADQARLARVKRDKAHADLKRDAGLLRNDGHGTASLNHGGELLEYRKNVRLGT